MKMDVKSKISELMSECVQFLGLQGETSLGLRLHLFVAELRPHNRWPRSSLAPGKASRLDEVDVALTEEGIRDGMRRQRR